jgi:hypothetical protein
MVRPSFSILVSQCLVEIGLDHRVALDNPPRPIDVSVPIAASSGRGSVWAVGRTPKAVKHKWRAPHVYVSTTSCLGPVVEVGFGLSNIHLYIALPETRSSLLPTGELLGLTVLLVNTESTGSIRRMGHRRLQQTCRCSKQVTGAIVNVPRDVALVNTVIANLT